MASDAPFLKCHDMKLALSVLLTLIFFHNSGCREDGNSSFPILVLATKANFSLYTPEILKAEGLNEFITDSLTNTKVTLQYLKRFDIVLLGETSLTSDDKGKLTAYVKDGGNLIALRPDRQLDEIFGLIVEKGTVDEGYIKIDTGDIGKGLVSATMQFHGKSDIYKLNGASEIAGLYSDSCKSAESPSVVINNYGNGHAVAFSYNLAKSIVLTRQGNPEWAGEERDKVDGPTATDLFYPLSGEVQWNDPAKIAIPQADEQMRLLTHIIEKLSSYKKPLPRFWYFPDNYKSVFIFTIDGEDTPADEIDSEIKDVNARGASVTLYEIGTYISPSQVNSWRSKGNEVAIHYNDVPNYANPTFFNMNVVLDTMTSNFHNAYGISPGTVRNHWVVWCSKDSSGMRNFAEQAMLEEKYGIGLDCNYYQFGGNKVYPNWLGDVGHFTGSGIPMRFSDASGNILHIYQSNTQLPDETWLKDNIENKSITLIDRSIDEEYYSWINANFHTWYWPECRQAGLKVLDYCNKRGVPVWTAERVFEFLRMKDESFFSDFVWSGNRLTFRLNSAINNPERLTMLLPLVYTDRKISAIRINRQNVKFDIIIIKGSAYASVPLNPGRIYNISARYL
jgi:hypothetical protein